MGGGMPSCKVTGEPIIFFPSVCLPLHHYLMLEYSRTMKDRQRQDSIDVQERYGFSLPSVSNAPEEEGDEGFMEEFTCVVSQELAFEPCALSSGSIVSAYCISESGFKK